MLALEGHASASVRGRSGIDRSNRDGGLKQDRNGQPDERARSLQRIRASRETPRSATSVTFMGVGSEQT
jgi:hypothetical protein